MKRLQIQLTDEQEAAIRRHAARHGRSVAAVVRQAVDRYVGQEARKGGAARVMALAGKYRDREGARDVARNHDRYLGDAYRR
ncbi:MAG TPA: CopG family transcriptional regulator [Candidatus Limnocylindria bacterium]|nr:CopG family transcriptional regulator [Candidatus Limnocylindria bacterium]